MAKLVSNNNYMDRQQYIKMNHELKETSNQQLMEKANEQRIELEKLLENLSIQSDNIISKQMIGGDIVSKATTVPKNGSHLKMNDNVGKKSKNNDNSSYRNYEKYLGEAVNRGKTIIETMKSKDESRSKSKKSINKIN